MVPRQAANWAQIMLRRRRTARCTGLWTAIWTGALLMAGGVLAPAGWSQAATHPTSPPSPASQTTQTDSAVKMAEDELGLFEKRITVKVLPNGLTLLLCERPDAPVFSYYTLVNAGDANDPGGQSGLAHMFEHLAFKGTEDIGTTDWPAEKIALAKVEQTYADYDRYARKRIQQDPAKLKQLRADFLAAQAEAQKYVVPNQFTQLAEENGAVGINASTGLDSTEYFWSMPANRLQLWAYMESDRIGHPVPREFYKERDVVLEERRMRTDSDPIGRLIEQFAAAAYIAHPYHRPGIGFESEIVHLSATEADAFHKIYYTPSNIVIAVVGDLKTADVLPTLEKYFGSIPSGPPPEPMATVEPPQTAEKFVVLRETSQPFYIEGYHRPNYLDPDDQVYDAIADILSNGRVSRLYRSLVRDQRIAAESQGFSGFPGDKYPGLFAFYAVPLPGHTPQQMRTAIHKEIDLLKTADVSDDELAMFKTRARADLLRSLGGNQGLATELATYQTRYGDWRELFHQMEKIDKVSKADIRRVSNKVFSPSNCTYAMIENASEPQQPAPGQTPAHTSGGAQ
jgi:predicted Zn-dependent peptidase